MGDVLIKNLIEVQFNAIDDLINTTSLIYKDFSYLKQTIDIRQFNKVRRVFRDELIKEWLGNEENTIDYDFRKINTKEKEFYFSCSYSGYKIVVIKSVTKIGIDMEMYKRISLDNIHLFASSDELNSLGFEFGLLSLLEKSTLIWCIKESVGKLFDIGLSKGFDTFRLKRKDKIYLSTFLKLSCECRINIFYKMFTDYCIVFAKFHMCEVNNLR
jgi:hypothetical protein